MRVAFDSRAIPAANGVGRYSRCLLKALGETVSGEDQLLASARPSATVRAGSADIFHAPWMDGAMLHSPCPMVVTVHDVIAPKRRSEHLRAGLRLRMRHLALQRAVSVIVPSHAVAADAVEHHGLEPERIVVIPEAADSSMYRRSEREIEAARFDFGLPERYLVWVGDLQHPAPGRQIARLAAASRELPLVLVGPTRPWAHELHDVTLTGRVSDDQLAAIYSGAHALLAPGEDVGFGLSAVEALACGTPVVACDAPALREALDGRATFVEPGDIDGLIAAAEAAHGEVPDPPAWSWRDAALATWRTYERSRAAVMVPRSGRRSPRRRPATEA